MNQNKYIRQITLPEVGNSGQKKLKESRVLVIGAGGLGNAILPYLASAGIGIIGVVDGDKIALSNLHRQVLFSEKDIGESKTEVACRKLSDQFPEVSFSAFNNMLSGENALALFKNYNIIVDATDNIEIRYLINDVCIITDKPFVHASIYRFQFQVALFNVNGSGTYRCLYPSPPKTIANCQEAGVMPSTVAIAGLFQANEVFKYLLNIGKLQTNSLLLVDTLNNEQNHFAFQRKNQEHITPAYFENEYESVRQIAFKDTKHDGLFLDVREAHEFPDIELFNYLQIPITRLDQNLDRLPQEKPIYIFCQSGVRSKIAFGILKENGFSSIYCLIENVSELKNFTNKVFQ